PPRRPHSAIPEPPCRAVHSPPGHADAGPVCSGAIRAMDEDAHLDGLPIRQDGLLTAVDAAAAGCTHRVRALHQSGRLVRVWPGIYSVTDQPAGPGPAVDALRYRQKVRAAAQQMPGQVFTSYSAAALLGLPIVGRWPQDVYVLATGPNGSRRAGVRSIGHRWQVPEERVDGIRITSPAHTLIQLARHASLAAALVAADGALRDLPYAPEEPVVTPEELCAEHQRLRPYRGSTRAAAVLQRATTLADHPLESISRLVIEELGFAAPQLQHRIWLPGLGEYVWVDFYWPELGIAME